MYFGIATFQSFVKENLKKKQKTIYTDGSLRDI